MKISLPSKLVLTTLVIANSDHPENIEYVRDTDLLPSYHLTPETIKELKDNLLIDAANHPTRFGIWFTHNCGVSDNPPAFISLVKKLSTKARYTLMCYCLGELTKEHQTSKNPTKKLIIEGFLNKFEKFFTGEITNKKSISSIVVEYDDMLEYNKNK